MLPAYASQDLLEHHQNRDPLPVSSLDMIFLVKPGIEKLPVSEIMKEIEVFIDEKAYQKTSTKS